MPTGIELRRPANNQDGRDILIPIVSGMTELIFGNPGLFVNRPGFIAGPSPDSGLAGVVQSLTRVNCRRWAAADKTNFSTNVNQQNADLCGLYLDTLTENPSPGSIELPFSGGQCPGVTYRVTTANYQGSTGNFIGNNQFDGLGPVSVIPSGNQAPAPGSPPCPGGQTYWTGKALAFNGVERVSWGGGCSVRDNTEVVSVVRLDGMPDDCGDPTPIVMPPSTVEPGAPIPPTITIDFPGIGPITVEVTLDPTGQPVICIPLLDTCETVEEPTGDPAGGGGNVGPGSAGDPESTGDAGEASGEAGEGEELVGLLVSAIAIEGSPNRFENNPLRPYRGIGYVRMGYPGRLGNDASASAVALPQFFHAQQPGLTNWAVASNIGFNLSVTPYYRSFET